MTGRPVVTAAAVPDAPDAPRRGVCTAVVVNPTKVSRPDAVRAEITRNLAAHGWPAPSWLETTRSDPGGGQTARSVRMGADVVFAAGGDGTVRACAEQLAGTATALAMLPFGTGNLLARNLGAPAAIADVVALVTSGRRRRLDVGVVDGQFHAAERLVAAAAVNLSGIFGLALGARALFRLASLFHWGL